MEGEGRVRSNGKNHGKKTPRPTLFIVPRRSHMKRRNVHLLTPAGRQQLEQLTGSLSVEVYARRNCSLGSRDGQPQVRTAVSIGWNAYRLP